MGSKGTVVDNHPMSALATRTRRVLVRAARDLRAATLREVVTTTIAAMFAGALFGLFAGGSTTGKVAAGLFFGVAWGASMLVWVVRTGRQRLQRRR
jgi:hypothetical protein